MNAASVARGNNRYRVPNNNSHLVYLAILKYAKWVHLNSMARDGVLYRLWQLL